MQYLFVDFNTELFMIGSFQYKTARQCETASVSHSSWPRAVPSSALAPTLSYGVGAEASSKISDRSEIDRPHIDMLLMAHGAKLDTRHAPSEF